MRSGLILFLAPVLWAQESLNVSSGGLRTLVDDYLTGIAQKHWKQRDAEIAALRTKEDVARRQVTIREKILASI